MKENWIKRFRKAEWSDIEFIRETRNDPLNREGFINQNITKEEHECYMKKHLDKYYICDVKIKNKWFPTGWIGIHEDIRLCVHFAHHNQGIGSYMLKQLQKHEKEQFSNTFAKVKVDNISSQKLFEKMGFEKKYFMYEFSNEENI